MKTTALLCLQHFKIDELLAALEEETNAEKRVMSVVEVVEHVTAHLAVKKNVIYPAVDDSMASALVVSWHGNAAARRGLLLLARATYHDELCAQRARDLRTTLEAHAKHDETLVDALEATLSPREAELLGEDAERFFASCMCAREMATIRVVTAEAS